MEKWFLDIELENSEHYIKITKSFGFELYTKVWSLSWIW